jgi:D-arginine dehydrogenase
MTERIECDVCVVGAGIAGASVAALLARDRRVVVIEAEQHPGYHTTGRSVAIYTETVSGRLVTPLTRASLGFFESPPEGFSDAPLTRRRGAMSVGRAGQEADLDAEFARLSPNGGRRRLDGREALSLVPILRPDKVDAAVLDPGAFDMDVDALHQGWLRALRQAGGQVLTAAPLREARWTDAAWRLRAGEHEVNAKILVDAAGAWGDEVAALCGVRPLGLEPRRRTVAVMAAEGWPVDAWPMCIAADHSLYFKPDAGRLLVSAMDQTPSAPCDAWADDMDVAESLDRFATLTDLPLRKPLRTWAGLRTFAPDEEPVAGYDPDQPGFFWLVGQGGAGIQTCPALARAAAALVAGRPLADDLVRAGVSAETLGPARFRA